MNLLILIVSLVFSSLFVSLEAALCDIIVDCFNSPCEESTCNVNGAICKANNCGGCYAEWYLNGNKLSSDECISGRVDPPPPMNTAPPTTSPTNPLPNKAIWEQIKSKAEENRNKFEAYNINIYIYSLQPEMDYRCFGVKKFIAVQYGTVVGAQYDDNTLSCNDDDIEWQYRKSINDWFDHIIWASNLYMRCDTSPSWICNYPPYAVKYHSLFGYPTKIDRIIHWLPGFDSPRPISFSDFEYFDDSQSIIRRLIQSNHVMDSAKKSQDITRVCGGIAGIKCDSGYECVDDPQDECNIECGGIDCNGICVKIWDDGNGNGAICDGLQNIKCPEGFTCFDDPMDECKVGCGGDHCPGFCAHILIE